MRVAVVTGAGRGIGAAVAHHLAASGWSLALGDAPGAGAASGYPLAGEEDLKAVAWSCRAAGADVVSRRCDVRRQDDVDALVSAAAELGEVTAAVAVAGLLAGGGPAWTLPDDVFEQDLAVNYRGVVHLARAAVPLLLRTGAAGRFVAVTSAAASGGLPLLASYVAAKHAAAGFVRSLAADLGPTGVTANAVAPGSTDTVMLEATAAVYGLPSHERFAEHARTGRLLQPAEVAAAVGWLCSPAAGGVTGATLPVDGGFTG